MSAFSDKSEKRTKDLLVFSLCFLLLLSLFSAGNSILVHGAAGDIEYAIKSTVTYVNPTGGTRVWNLTEEDRTVGLFMNNSWQNVEFETVTCPLEALQTDTDSNKVAVLKLPNQQLRPGENASFTAEYRITSRPRSIPIISETQSGALDAIPPDLKENYTRAEGPWLVKDLELVSLAHQIAGSERKVLKIIEYFVSWISHNISYAVHEFPFYPNETLGARQGDCDDQAVLLITLCRILGIPAYLQIGAIYMPELESVDEFYWNQHARIVQNRIGWHGWAMVYVPPWGWLPVDLTYVIGGLAGDALNAVRFGAVVWQKTIQYMNCSKVDHVAESRQARDFILANGFFVHLRDEMTEIKQADTVEGFDPVPIVTVGLTIAALSVGYLFVVRRWRRRLDKPEVAAYSLLFRF